MPAKGNQVIPNTHFHKDWQKRVKVWFARPMKAQKRRRTRLLKAAAIAPRPLKKLKPIVRCPGYRHNIRQRLGKGFTFLECKEAGLNYRYARTIGIYVDKKRKNKSVEGLQLNVQRLKEYMSKLVVFPKNGKMKNTKEQNAELKKEKANAVQLRGEIMPIPKVDKNEVEVMEITDDMKNYQAYHALRQARAKKRWHGKRLKKIADAAANDLAKK